MKNQITAKELMMTIKTQLAKAGLPRTSSLAGGEVTGWTSATGSTGFSVRKLNNKTVSFHVIISGKKAGLKYREYDDKDSRGDSIRLHEPLNMEDLHSKIESVFTDLGIKVNAVESGGFQMHWDDDVEYDIIAQSPNFIIDSD